MDDHLLGGAVSAPVSAAQAGLFAGLAYTLPGAVWLGAELLGGLRSPPSEPLIRSAVEALSIGQAFAALLLPRGSAKARADRPAVSLQPDLLGASLVLISAPAPLWVAIAFTRVIPLGWLTGTVALLAALIVRGGHMLRQAIQVTVNPQLAERRL